MDKDTKKYIDINVNELIRGIMNLGHAHDRHIDREVKRRLAKAEAEIISARKAARQAQKNLVDYENERGNHFTAYLGEWRGAWQENPDNLDSDFDSIH